MFGRPIGQNQGVQFPIAEALHRGRGGEPDALQGLRAVRRAASPAARKPTWPSTSPPKASWEAANACLQFHGGFGFAAEYDVERKFRETRLYQVAPISTNLVLAYVAGTCWDCRAPTELQTTRTAAAHHVVDEEHDDRADHGADEAGGLTRPRRCPWPGRGTWQASAPTIPSERGHDEPARRHGPAGQELGDDTRRGNRS